MECHKGLNVAVAVAQVIFCLLILVSPKSYHQLKPFETWMFENIFQLEDFYLEDQPRTRFRPFGRQEPDPYWTYDHRGY